MPRPLNRSFYARKTTTVARELLGCVLVRRVRGATLRARIVETEAYVYFTYGMHHLLNAVTEPAGSPAAVLIRAAEPVSGIESMCRSRGVRAHHLLASGPAKLCQAFGLDLAWNGADLCAGDLTIEPGEPVPEARVGRSARIGCERVPEPWGAIPWRYFVADSPHVSPGRAAPKLLVTSPGRIGNNLTLPAARNRRADNAITRR